MIEDLSLVDFLGSWRPEEILFKNKLRQAKKIDCFYITGIKARNKSWTRLLKDKKVLVVHPFADTIKRQYETNRELIYTSELTLPKFKSLEIVKAVQSIAGNKAGFNNWFEALRYMEDQISQKDFDIALIGCGAYGFCLAAHVKRLGKQVLHLGGDLQLHFGIKGKRWDYKGMYNEFWVSPSESERPLNFENVEGGCYW